jgi:outer membrane scaffolding protein for murein synthesis (MipA/OmpV family)
LENPVSKPLATALTYIALTAGTSLAQEPAADAETAFPGGEMTGQIGALGFYAPDYEGSDHYEFSPVPMVDLTWRERIFLSTREGLGAYAVSTEQFRVGAAVNYGFGRDDDDVGLGDGIGDVDGGVTGALIAKWMHGPFFVSSSLLHQLTGDDTGFLMTISAGGIIPVSERFLIIGSASIQAADDTYMDAYFGLSGADAAASGLTAFDADAGFKSAGVTVGLGYDVFESWTVMTMAGYTRLLGDAADSPIIDTADQFTVGAGLTYRFGPPPGPAP